MIFVKDSFTIVLLGDWNKLYIQPDWVAQNVYERQEIEIGVNGQGTEFNVTYRCNEVIIAPTQSQVMFTACDVEIGTIDYIVNCVNNFLMKATTPILSAYGLNCEFVESDAAVLADVIDSISDNSTIIEQGYEINAAKISRTLIKDGGILNVEMIREGNGAKIHFNEHHGSATTEMPVISSAQVNSFISNCNGLVGAFGYDLEGDDE